MPSLFSLCLAPLVCLLGQIQTAPAAEETEALDTLAEVYFRRGDREEAIRLAGRCSELEPENPHFREPIAQFEAAP